MSYYPETDSHVREKVEALLDLSNYATKKELEHSAIVDASNLAIKSDFIALKAEVDKQDTNKLVNGLAGLNYSIPKPTWFWCWQGEICSYRLEKSNWCSE